jgi:hypothetical protein
MIINLLVSVLVCFFLRNFHSFLGNESITNKAQGVFNSLSFYFFLKKKVFKQIKSMFGCTHTCPNYESKINTFKSLEIVNDIKTDKNPIERAIRRL